MPSLGSCSNCVQAQETAKKLTSASVDAADDLYGSVGAASKQTVPTPQAKETQKIPVPQTQDIFTPAKSEAKNPASSQTAQSKLTKQADAQPALKQTSTNVTTSKRADAPPSQFARFSESPPSLKQPVSSFSSSAKATPPPATQVAPKTQAQAQPQSKESQLAPAIKRDEAQKQPYSKEVQRSPQKHAVAHKTNVTSHAEVKSQNSFPTSRNAPTQTEALAAKAGKAEVNALPSDKKNNLQEPLRTSTGSIVVAGTTQAKPATMMQGLLNALSIIPFMGKTLSIVPTQIFQTPKMPVSTKAANFKSAEGASQKYFIQGMGLKGGIIVNNAKTSVMSWFGKIFSFKSSPEAKNNSSAGQLGSIWSRMKEKFRKKKNKTPHKKEEVMKTNDEMNVLEPNLIH